MKKLIPLFVIVFLANIEDFLLVKTSVLKDNPVREFKPQIAVKCGGGFFAQFLDPTGKWLTSSVELCDSSHENLLQFCQKVYSGRNITNIMESTSEVVISDWCSKDHAKCDHTFSVRPYKCLPTGFQSEALYVPEACMFDHVHSENECEEMIYWNKTATSACSDRNQILHSSTLLMPCGINQFSGIEFVCCPLDNPSNTLPFSSALKHYKNSDDEEEEDDEEEDDDDEDDDDDDEDDDDDDEEEKEDDDSDTDTDHTDDDDDSDDDDLYEQRVSKSVIHTKVPKNDESLIPSKVDGLSSKSDKIFSNKKDEKNFRYSKHRDDALNVYFGSFDKEREHEKYVEAKNSLKESKRYTVLKIMKDWGDSERHFQNIKKSEPIEAEKYKNKVTQKFQKTISALEKEQENQAKNLKDVHEQRVEVLLSDRKQKTIESYLQALEKENPDLHVILRTLQAFIKAEEKDKMHAIHAYERHLNKNPLLASEIKHATIKRINENNRMINKSVNMLKKLPSSIALKVLPKIKTYIKELKIRVGDFESVETSIKSDSPSSLSFESTSNEIEQVRARKEISGEQFKEENSNSDGREHFTSPYSSSSYKGSSVDKQSGSVARNNNHHLVYSNKNADSHYTSNSKDGSLVYHNVKIMAYPLKSNSRTTNSSHNRSSFLMPLSLSLGFIMFSVIIIASLFYSKRRSFGRARVPTHPIDQLDNNPYCTSSIEKGSNIADMLESKHLSKMQFNGYENPTYKYFEKSSHSSKDC